MQVHKFYNVVSIIKNINKFWINSLKTSYKYRFCYYYYYYYYEKKLAMQHWESDLHSISPKAPAPQYQPLEKKKKMGKQ